MNDDHDDPARVYSAVPVLRVASVKTSAAWYASVLGFAGGTYGPPDDPTFAILSRDDVEIMLQKVRSGVAASRAAGSLEGGWDVYVRIDDVEAFREQVRAHVPDVGPIEEQEYGCREFEVLDPDGHVIVLGECG